MAFVGLLVTVGLSVLSGAVETSSSHDYADALRKSLLFLRAQRSGDLGQDNPIPWRTKPAFLKDGADVGVDLSRGYFDAGDYVKYGQPAAYSISVLAWGALEFHEGFQAAGALDELKSAVRWGTDFILQAASQLDQRCRYHAQVGRLLWWWESGGKTPRPISR